MVWESWLGGVAPESLQNRYIYMILEGCLGGGAPESLQNQCICLVLEGWLGGQGTRNHCNICAFVLFWKVGWGSGAPEIIAKLLNLHCLGRLVAGGGAPESLKN